MHEFGFSDQVNQQDRTVRFVKLQVVSFYGKGGGLRYLSFDGPLKDQGKYISTIVSKYGNFKPHTLVDQCLSIVYFCFIKDADVMEKLSKEMN